MKKANWIEIIEANREKVVEKMVEAKREACGAMSGWHLAVEINKDGECWVSGAMSQGFQSISSWEGKTFIVASIGSWTADMDLSEWIEGKPELLKEYQAQKDSDDGYDTVQDFMNEIHPEILKEWEKEAEEYEIDFFESEQADEVLDQRIKRIKEN